MGRPILGRIVWNGHSQTHFSAVQNTRHQQIKFSVSRNVNCQTRKHLDVLGPNAFWTDEVMPLNKSGIFRKPGLNHKWGKFHEGSRSTHGKSCLPFALLLRGVLFGRATSNHAHGLAYQHSMKFPFPIFIRSCASSTSKVKKRENNLWNNIGIIEEQSRTRWDGRRFINGLSAILTVSKQFCGLFLRIWFTV